MAKATKEASTKLIDKSLHTKPVVVLKKQRLQNLVLYEEKYSLSVIVPWVNPANQS